MSSEVTTTIVAIAYPATSLHSEVTGIAFLWLGKMRTLRFENYDFPRFARPPKGHRSSHNRAVLGTERRKEIEHNCPKLRIFAAVSQSGAPAFHIEKTSGRPFTEGQLVYTNLYG